jgi:hypothetical protein
MKKTLCILCILLFSIFKRNSSTFFLNRYWVPEIRDTPIHYKKRGTMISLSPITMKTTDANGTTALDKPHPYELDGFVTIENLYHSYAQFNQNQKALPLPSEWLANKISMPMRLQSHIEATGLTWAFQYELSPECSIGWNGGYTKMVGIMDPRPQENPAKYTLKESLLFEIHNVYKTITHAMGMTNNCTEFNNFADNSIYIDLHKGNDYTLYLRRLEYALRFGYVIPSSHTTQEKTNPADIPGGLDGFSALYISPELNLILKEDVCLDLVGKLFYLFPMEKFVRKKKWFESNRFGGFFGQVDVQPGFIYQFSPTLSIEGLRNGLGLELAYETYGQTKTIYGFSDNDIIQQAQMNIEELSRWNQEHCIISLFYDFQREIELPCYQTLLSFSAYIPVSFFFAYQSGRSLGLALTLEMNY